MMIAHYIENSNSRLGESRAYFFLPARPARAAELAATAARISRLKAASSIFSPSRRSIARLVLPSRLELKSFFGSSIDAPRKNVSFTTCLYASPVQTPPACDQTGVPPDFGFSHFHSSTMSGSASWMSWRTCARVCPRQSSSSSIRLVILAEAVSSLMPVGVAEKAANGSEEQRKLIQGRCRRTYD